MGNDFEVGVEVAASPNAVWRLAGDPERIVEWFAPVVACEVDGDERRATMANGNVLVERLFERHDVGRSYSYAVLSGIPGLTSHRATIRVIPTERGSLLLWRQTATSEVEGYDMESRLAGVMRTGLERLRDQVEAAGEHVRP